MDLINIIIPKEPHALIITGVQVFFFIVWIFLLVISAARLKRTYKKIEELENISELSEIIKRRFSTSARTEENPSVALISEATALRRFDEFCENTSLNKFLALAKHLKAIFLAGFKEGVLDVNSLVKSTNGELIAGITGFRAVLSLFIILGLLGTLAGLAISLTEFSNLLPTGDNMTQQSLSKALTTLLPKLGGAFTTSIFGVVFTIAGVILFTFYQYRYIYPLSRKLDQETLTNWIPNLVTTPAQRLLEKLQLSEHQMQKNFEAAQQVASFAEQIKDDASELSESIKNAKSPLKILRDASNNLASFSENFVRSVERLTFFQGDLQSLYREMRENSAAFQTTVKRLVDDNSTFHQTVETKFEDQRKQTQQLFTAYLAQSTNLTESLKFFEQEYLKDRQNLDTKLTESLEAARDAYSQLGKQNQAVIEGLGRTVGEPLKEELTAGLNRINTSLENNVVEQIAATSKQLNEVVVSLNSINNPLTKAADKIEGTAKHFDDRTTKLLTNLQERFLEQNQVSIQQVEKLTSLGDGVTNLSGRLVTVRDLVAQLENLNLTLGQLRQNVEKLNAASPAGENGSYGPEDRNFWQRWRK